MVDGVLVGKEGRQVKNDLRFFKKHPLQLDFVEDAAFDEKDVGQRRDVPDAGRRKIVQHNYFGCTQPGHRSGEIRADGSGPAGDEDGFIFVIR